MPIKSNYNEMRVRANSKEIMRPESMCFYKNLQKVLDARKTKAASIHMRKQILESQKKLNYQLEYDRIRGVLSQSILKGVTVESLDRRKQELERLGAKAVNHIS